VALHQGWSHSSMNLMKKRAWPNITGTENGVREGCPLEPEEDIESASKIKRNALIVFALLSPLLLVQAWILGAAPDVPFATMPSCESNSQNCAHLGGGDTFRMDVGLNTTNDVELNTSLAALTDWVVENDLQILVEESVDGEEYYVHAVAITPFWRFPDDVVVQLRQLSTGGTEFELHSQSRLGQGDLGVNPDRLLELHAILEDA
jgi:hypothetical protein